MNKGIIIKLLINEEECLALNVKENLVSKREIDFVHGVIAGYINILDYFYLDWEREDINKEAKNETKS